MKSSRQLMLIVALAAASSALLSQLGASEAPKTITVPVEGGSSLTIGLQEDGKIGVSLLGENLTVNRVLNPKAGDLARLFTGDVVQIEPDPTPCGCEKENVALARCDAYVRQLETDLETCEGSLEQCSGGSNVNE